MPNENIRSHDSGIFQCRVHLVDPKRARVLRPGIAPSSSRVVVCAHLSESGDFGLHKPPIEGVTRAQDDNGWASCPRAIKVDSIATNVDELTERCWRIDSRAR